MGSMCANGTRPCAAVVRSKTGRHTHRRHAPSHMFQPQKPTIRYRRKTVEQHFQAPDQIVRLQDEASCVCVIGALITIAIVVVIAN